MRCSGVGGCEFSVATNITLFCQIKSGVQCLMCFCH